MGEREKERKRDRRRRGGERVSRKKRAVFVPFLSFLFLLLFSHFSLLCSSFFLVIEKRIKQYLDYKAKSERKAKKIGREKILLKFLGF